MIEMNIKGAIVVAVALILTVQFVLWLLLWIKARKAEGMLNHIIGKIGL